MNTYSYVIFLKINLRTHFQSCAFSFSHLFSSSGRSRRLRLASKCLTAMSASAGRRRVGRRLGLVGARVEVGRKSARGPSDALGINVPDDQADWNAGAALHCQWRGRGSPAQGEIEMSRGRWTLSEPFAGFSLHSL